MIGKLWPTFDNTLAGFSEELREECDFTKSKAATYCGLHHATISRYDNHKLVPHPGYLSCLACYIIEKKSNPETVKAYKKHLLEQINAVNREIRGQKKTHRKPSEAPYFRNWDELKHFAEEYRKRRQKSAPSTVRTPVLPKTPMSTSSTVRDYLVVLLEEIGVFEKENLGLPAGSHNLLDIPFLTGWKVTTVGGSIPMQLDPPIPQPIKVHLLLQGGWAIQEFINATLGTIFLEFANREVHRTDLILGYNLRDWTLHRQNAVTIASSPYLREVWRGTAPDGTPGRIDMLTIDVPEQYHHTSLTTIHLDDISEMTTYSDKPCIHLLAVTVEYYPSDGRQEKNLPVKAVPTEALDNGSSKRDNFRYLRIPALFDDIRKRFGGDSSPLGILEETLERDYACQYFEDGFMFWWDNPYGQNRIWVINGGGRAYNGKGWSHYDDTWTEREAPLGCPEIHPLNGPRYGFGKIWCENSDIRKKLGPALDTEFGSVNIFEKSTLQILSGGVMFYVPIDKKIWLLLNNGYWHTFDRRQFNLQK